MTGLDPGLLDEVRSSLEEHRSRLRKEILDEGVDPDSQDLAATQERGFADGGHTTAERGRIIALVRELRISLGDVERALGRMDRGTYGTCERCGDPIAPERLEAIPWARLCISCKQKTS